MADIDIRKLPQTEIVLHFGGRPNEVNAFTFSNSLVAFAEALQEINRQTAPGTSVEISIEGVGPGSFRAKIATKLKPLSGLWKEVGKPVLVGVLATIIYHRVIGAANPVIKVDDTEVVIQQGDDRIIVPRYIYDAHQRLPQPREVERHIARAFSAIEDDPSVTDFGLTASLEDSTPVVPVSREKFAILSAPVQPIPEEGRRYRDERTKVTILKAIFQRGNRKWEFVWQGGVRISAAIQDAAFFDKLASGEFWFAQGDELDVVLRIHQKYDDVNGVHINEGYEVIRVFDITHRARQGRLKAH